MKKGVVRKQIDLSEEDLRQLKKYSEREKRSIKNFIEKIISDFLIKEKVKSNL